MVSSLIYWCDLYRRLRSESFCLDIETTHFDGPISVIGLYRPKDGEIEYLSFVKGKNLDADNLKAAFAGTRMLITFNGLNHDIPKIRAEFPGVIPDNVKVIDLYLFARKLGIGTSLKVLENTFNIERFKVDRKGISIRLWNQYQKGDLSALDTLLEYNKDDVVDLYPLAEKLVEMAYKKGC